MPNDDIVPPIDQIKELIEQSITQAADISPALADVFTSELLQQPTERATRSSANAVAARISGVFRTDGSEVSDENQVD